MSEYTDPLRDSLTTSDSGAKMGGGSKWQHALLILLFVAIYQISAVVFGAIALFQIVSLLLTDDRNERLNEFSTWLTHYMYLVLQYICLNSSSRPWPLDNPETKIEIIHD